MVYQIIKSKKIYNDNNALVLEIPDIKMENQQSFGLIICQNILTKNAQKVIIKKGKDFIYLMNINGNYMRSDQLKPRTYYPITYGIDPIHITIMRPVMNTSFEYNINKKKD